MKLNELIKDYRKKNHLSLRAFGEKCGLTAGYISMIENNGNPSNNYKEVVPSVESYKKLAQGMGISFDTLLSMVNDKISLNEEPQIEAMDFVHSVGAKITQQREAKKMTIAQLAKECEIDSAQLEQMEKGIDRKFSPSLMYKMCDVLGVPYGTFINNLSPVTKFGDNIRILREINMKTIEEVSAEIGITAEQLSNIESNIETPTFNEIERVCQYFNYCVGFFIGNDFKLTEFDESFIVETRMKFIAKSWLDVVQESRFTNAEIDEIISFANYIVYKRKK